MRLVSYSSLDSSRVGYFVESTFFSRICCRGKNILYCIPVLIHPKKEKNTTAAAVHIATWGEIDVLATSAVVIGEIVVVSGGNCTPRRRHQAHLNVELLAGEEVVEADHLIGTTRKVTTMKTRSFASLKKKNTLVGSRQLGIVVHLGD